MLAKELSSELFTDTELPADLLQIHRSKISLHAAKADYRYPIIRLPHTFSKLAGLPTRIYQTVYEGALAFLVVIASTDTESDNAKTSSKAPVLTWRRSPVRIRPSPSVFGFVKAGAFI
jgi:hypothetical protein